MKKEELKKNTRILKGKETSRECLLEITNSSIDHRQPLKKRSKSFKCPNYFQMIPNDLMICIFGFFSASELITEIQLVCKDWRYLANSPILWKELSSANVELKWLVRCVECLAERRSKGRIYKGYLRSTEAPVILRKVNLDVTNAGFDDGVPTSLLREIGYLSEFSHPGIVKILGSEVIKKTVYTCTEQCTYNLKEFIKFYETGNCRNIPLPMIKSLSKQMFEALAYIHDKGVIHRNLKPDNILITDSGQLKITDFTLSRLASIPHYMYTPEDPKERNRSGREIRRLWYRAPELLLRSDIYGFEIDVWSVGCLIAELITKMPLFNGESEIEQLFKIFKVAGVNEDEVSTQAKSFPKWEKINFSDVLAEPNSEEFKRIISALIPAREQIFTVLRQIGAIIGASGLDLLQKCLDPNPKTRITASQALCHPFFDIEMSSPSDSLQSYISHLLSLESQISPSPKYLIMQKDINAAMRSILVDWLIDVAVHFEVNDETLHLAVNYIDRVLSVAKVERSNLQLVGVACMKIADVFHERSKEYYRQENSIEYAYITADEFTAAQVVEMEKEILKRIKFRVLAPTTLFFIKAYQAELNLDLSTYKIALFLSDLMLLSYESLKYKYSLLAAGIIYISCAFTQGFPAPQNADFFTNFPSSDFSSVIEFIKSFWLDAKTNPQISRFEAINHKHQDINPRQLWPPSTHYQNRYF
ncbi:unnamed protein product [Blepharisma stoltei]|uniref:Cyclin-F n=1 Tax=Blepharisma stoltei TaxID=1481888 RepID=A0AAU9JBK6_9CILI|nr:unnamed protein product [Blepharisma stoltei]